MMPLLLKPEGKFRETIMLLLVKPAIILLKTTSGLYISLQSGDMGNGIPQIYDSKYRWNSYFFSLMVHGTVTPGFSRKYIRISYYTVKNPASMKLTRAEWYHKSLQRKEKWMTLEGMDLQDYCKSCHYHSTECSTIIHAWNATGILMLFKRSKLT